MVSLVYRKNTWIAVLAKDFQNELGYVPDPVEFGKLVGWRVKRATWEGIVFIWQGEHTKRNVIRRFQAAIRRWLKFNWWKGGVEKWWR